MHHEPAASGVEPTYAPSRRTVRQGGIPRTIPPLGGLGGAILFAHQLGWRSALLAGVVGALGGFLLLRLLDAHQQRGFRRREGAGSLLVAAVKYVPNPSGFPKDLNHRTGDEIAMGVDETSRPAVVAVFDARPHALQVVPLHGYLRRARPFEISWDLIECAEIARLGRRRATVVFLTRFGARHRFDVFAEIGRIRRMLATAHIVEAGPAAVPDIRVGDTVRAADGREGPVEAVVARAHDPGHAEVFVHFADTGTDSWDSSEVIVTRRNSDLGSGDQPVP